MFGINVQDIIPYVGYGFLAIFLIIAIAVSAGIYKDSKKNPTAPKIKSVKGGLKGVTGQPSTETPATEVEEAVPTEAKKSGGFLTRKRKTNVKETKPAFAPTAGSASLDEIKETLTVLGAARAGSIYGDDEEELLASMGPAPTKPSQNAQEGLIRPTQPVQASPTTQPEPQAPTPPVAAPPVRNEPLPLPPMSAGFAKSSTPAPAQEQETLPPTVAGDKTPKPPTVSNGQITPPPPFKRSPLPPPPKSF